jgi:hypothetical protein
VSFWLTPAIFQSFDVLLLSQKKIQKPIFDTMVNVVSTSLDLSPTILKGGTIGSTVLASSSVYPLDRYPQLRQFSHF